MDILIALLGFLVVVAVLGAPIAFGVWAARVYKRRIRAWADQRGYAVVRLQYKWMPPFIRLGVADTGCWFVEVQDEQGGIRHGYVHFRVPYLPPWVDVPWGKMKLEWR